MLIWPLVFCSMSVASQHRGTVRGLCTLKSTPLALFTNETEHRKFVH